MTGFRHEMSILDVLKDKSANWTRTQGAEESQLRELVIDCDFELPDAYVELLRYSSGGEGELAIKPGWFQLWPAAEVIKLNEEYGVNEFAHGFFGFGSNGGSEMFAFKREETKPKKVYMITFVGMDEREAIQVADSFEHFVQAMGRGFDESD